VFYKNAIKKELNPNKWADRKMEKDGQIKNEKKEGFTARLKQGF
jgi:hypothetical protein